MEAVPAAVSQKTFCNGRQTFGVVWHGPDTAGEGGGKAVSLDDIYGDIDGEDRPLEVVGVRRWRDSLQFIVRWHPRENGFQPSDSVVTSAELRRFSPSLLLDFYEQHLLLH